MEMFNTHNMNELSKENAEFLKCMKEGKPKMSA